MAGLELKVLNTQLKGKTLLFGIPRLVYVLDIQAYIVGGQAILKYLEVVFFPVRAKVAQTRQSITLDIDA